LWISSPRSSASYPRGIASRMPLISKAALQRRDFALWLEAAEPLPWAFIVMDNGSSEALYAAQVVARRLSKISQ
jgi:hypothetical protein